MNPFLSAQRVMSRKDALALLTAFFVSSIIPISAMARTAVVEKGSTAPSKSARFARQVVSGAFDAVFLFDHFFTKSSTVVSANYLDRTANPDSPFHAMYLKYQQGQIRRGDLVASLPHVALIGDSLSKNMHVSSVASTIWRARTATQRNWFLDTESSPDGIYSVYERIDKLTPLVAADYARGGAFVTSRSGDENLLRMLARVHNLAGQVDRVLKAKRFPDLLLIWIGHNNTNWVSETPLGEREHPEKHLLELASRFREDYARQMRRLISRAESEDHKVVIVVFGLQDGKTYFKARGEAEALHASNPTLYPYFEKSYRRFDSLRPAYQKNTTRFSIMMNGELRTMVADLNRDLKDCPNLRLQYSDALTNVDLSRLERLHRVDGQHLSVKGHNAVAEAAFTALAPSLQFLGIGPASASHSFEANQ